MLYMNNDLLNSNYDAYSLDNYDTAQMLCLDTWRQYPVVDDDGNIVGYITVDGEVTSLL